MLKHLYKTFLISILSGSLLMLQTNSVFAGVTAGDATNTTDSQGVITNTKTYHVDAIKEKDMLSSIAMLAIGFIGSRLATHYKPMTTDVMIAGAGGVAFIAGEVMSNMKFKGKIAEMTIEVQKKTDGTVNEEQLQRLEDLKKSYEVAKKATKTKKTLQLASSVAFAAAAAMAAFTGNKEIFMAMKCDASLKALSSLCKADSAVTGPYQAALAQLNLTRKKPAPSVTQDATVTPQIATLTATPLTCAASIMAATPLAAPALTSASTPVVAAANTNCKAALANMKINSPSTPVVDPTTNFNNNFIKSFLSSRITSLENLNTSSSSINTIKSAGFLDWSLSLLMPEAQASWMPLMGLAGGVALAFLAVSKSMGASIDLMMYNPMNRAIMFGGLAALAFMASKGSDSTLKKIEENLAAIDKIIADLNRLAKGVKAQAMKTQDVSIQTVNPGVNQTIPYTTGSTISSQCMTSNATSNCKTLSSELSAMPDFANLPDSFKDIATMSTGLADGLSGTSGVSGSTLSSAEALGAKSNAVGKILKAKQDQIEKITNSPGSFAKDQAKFLDGVAATVGKTLQQQGVSAGGMLSSLGGTPLGSPNSPSSASPEELKKTAAAPANVINQGASGGGKDQSMNLDFKDSSAGNLAMGTTVASKGPEYDIPTNEISGENGPSIFEVISIRYLKSGYPKLLEEESPTKKE